MDGTVTKIPNGYRLRFERELNHPIEKVWAALTQPERIADWLCHSGQIDLRPGGRVFLTEDGTKAWIESTVTEVDPPRVLAYAMTGPDWEGYDGGTLRWELEPSGAGTRLILSHEFPPMSEAEQRELRERLELPEGWAQLSSTLAGWHTILDRLPPALDGAKQGLSMDGWEELNERYKQLTPR